LKLKSYAISLIYFAVSMILMHQEIITTYQGAVAIALGIIIGMCDSILDYVQELNEKVDKWKTKF